MCLIGVHNDGGLADFLGEGVCCLEWARTVDRRLLREGLRHARVAAEHGCVAEHLLEHVGLGCLEGGLRLLEAAEHLAVRAAHLH